MQPQVAEIAAPPVAPPQAVAVQAAPANDVEDSGAALSGALEKAVAASASAPKGETASAGLAAGDAGAAPPPPPLPAAGTMSSALMTQSLPGGDAKAVSFDAVYAAHQAASGRDASPVVSAQAGRIGQEMGVEIARHVAAGRDEIVIRLDPPEMGRVEVRMSFDRDNSLRAVVAAEHHGALDLLKRDTGDLVARSPMPASARTASPSASTAGAGTPRASPGAEGSSKWPGRAGPACRRRRACPGRTRLPAAPHQRRHRHDGMRTRP